MKNPLEYFKQYKEICNYLQSQTPDDVENNKDTVRNALPVITMNKKIAYNVLFKYRVTQDMLESTCVKFNLTYDIVNSPLSAYVCVWFYEI